MSNVYYDNIDETSNRVSRNLALNVFYNLTPMMNYLFQAIRSQNSSAKYALWKFIDKEKIAQVFISNELQNQSNRAPEKQLKKVEIEERVRKRLNNGFWVQIITPPKYADDLYLFDNFYNAQYTYDSVNFVLSSRIEILDFDEELEILCLRDQPKEIGEDNRLYIRPNTMGLQKQINAIVRLQDKPHSSQRGLYRLFEDKDETKWDHIEEQTPDEWFVLTDTTRPGIEEQRRFVEIALGTPDFAILDGPPGSGKTTVITELIAQLLKEGKRVLLCGSTHVAVDNVLERMTDIPSVFAVRIGHESRISAEVQRFQINQRSKSAAEDLIKIISKSPDLSESRKMLIELAQRELDSTSPTYGHPFFRLMLESSNLVCGTTIGLISKIALFNSVQEGRTDPLFDVMILDEASKTPFTEFLVPAVWAKKWILAGDIKQLSPYVDTEGVRANVGGLFQNEVGQSIVMNEFWTRGGADFRGKPLLVVDEDESFQRNVIMHAYRTGNVVCVLNDRIRDRISHEIEESKESFDRITDKIECGYIANPTSFDLKERLISAGCDIVVGTVNDIERLPDSVPHSISAILGDLTHPAISGRFAWFNRRKFEPREERTWADEVSWRLIRRHELRYKEDTDLRDSYLNGILRMLPWFLEHEKVEVIERRLFEIESIALPSIIELLQYGFAPERSLHANALKTGLPPKAFADRHVKLSYQHRMHPDISRFPRIHFYEGSSLNDPDYMVNIRQWAYEKKLGENRVLWLHVNYKASKASTVNEHEVEALIEELRKFCDWAVANPKSSQDPWEVAVLSFYRGQERLLRTRISEELNQLPRRTYWYPNDTVRNVRIEVCTVDRFKGHEADIVLLSLVRTRKVGFIDSPNRVNVALTRARYQLVVIGNRAFFKSKKTAGSLYNLAIDKAVKPLRTYEPRYIPKSKPQQKPQLSTKKSKKRRRRSKK